MQAVAPLDRAGRRRSPASTSLSPGRAATQQGSSLSAGLRRRFAPHQLRHAHAVEMSQGISLIVIQRQRIAPTILREAATSSLPHPPRPPSHVNGHGFLPTGGHLIPHWWPSDLSPVAIVLPGRG